MATILDIGLLAYFSPAVVFLFIFVVLYAILQKIKILGDNQGINAVAALTVSLLFLFTSPAVELVTFITPWFVVLLVVIFATISMFLFMGAKPSDIAAEISSSGSVWTILIILLILLTIAITQVLGPSIAALTTEEGGPPGEQHFIRTVGQIVFHPKMLGVLFLLFIASQAIRLISQGF